MVLPVITLYQPWATFIMNGWKKIETRTHSRFACLAGKRILIHAGNTVEEDQIRNQFIPKGGEFDRSILPTGAILGSAMCYDAYWLRKVHTEAAMIDCSTTQRFGLFLGEVDIFPEPIYVPGSMGIWYFDTEQGIKCKKPTIK